MREVHFCTTCDFRLPYCVRTDRKFCGRHCWRWWRRHPGQKRPDFSPGGESLTELGRGQPKTLAEAQAALAEARAHAAQLEATARAQQLEDRKLRDKLTALRDELTSSRMKAVAERDALQDEFDQNKERLQRAEQQAQTSAAELKGLAEEKSVLTERLKEKEDEAAEHKAKREQTESDLAELRKLEAERGEKNASLSRSNEELSGKLETAQRALTQRDEDMKTQRQQLLTTERAHKEVHLVAESESRSLREEKQRRLAAEQRVAQLTLEVEALAKEAVLQMLAPDVASLVQRPLSELLAENREVRNQRDKIEAERELLVARLLEWMAPGQYLEHATAAGYDITKDPLIQIKLEEIRVENDLFRWQDEQNLTETARQLDPKQTVVEQAYAAALSARWSVKHKPHKRHKDVKWNVIGFVLDEKSEMYLRKLAQRRIDWMMRRKGEGLRQRSIPQISGS